MTGSFYPVPRGYIGEPGEGGGHFTIWASPPRLIRDGYVGCTDGRILRHLPIAGLQMTSIYCPPGSELDSGHVLLEWSSEGWVYALSLHSNTTTNRRLLRLIADHLVVVIG
jgi:hypothetical protein